MQNDLYIRENPKKLNQLASILAKAFHSHVNSPNMVYYLYCFDREVMKHTGIPSSGLPFKQNLLGPSVNLDLTTLKLDNNCSELSDFEIYTVFDVYRNFDWDSLRELPEYKPLEINTDLPYEEVLKALGFTAEDIDVIKAKQEPIRWMDEHINKTKNII